VVADSGTDILTLVAGTGISITTNATTDSVTITNSVSAGATAFTGLSDRSDLTVDQFYLPAITRLAVTANGSSAYRFDQYSTTDNPTVYAISGTTIAFNLNVSGHPFLVRTSGGTNFNTGLVHVSTAGVVSTGASAQGQVSGTLYWKIPAGSSGNYQYICSIHGGMVGVITINPDVVTATSVGLGNVTNESKATMFTSPALTGVTTVLDITSSGNLLVGTSSALSQAARATVVSAGNAVVTQCANGNTAYQSTNTSGTGIYYPAIFGNNGNTFSTCGLISVSGSTTTYATSSSNTTGAQLNASGIEFPATQVTSANANTLDDYEEGTWTPNQGGGLTVVGTFSSSGAYTKIGKLVTVQGILSATTSIAISAGDAVMFTNLPFASSPNRNPGVAVNTAHSAGLFVNIASTTVYSCGTIAASATIFVSVTYQTS
jgi:plastocyanin